MNSAVEHSTSVGPIGVDSLPMLDAIMQRAFDPQFGEAWNKAQCLAVLALPGYHLRGAWIDALGPIAGLTGFAISRIVAGESELLLFAVDPASRRHGTGSALLRDWFDVCQSRGVERQFLEMRMGNPARTLYEQFGFTQIACRTGYYRGRDGTLSDAITMQRLVQRG